MRTLLVGCRLGWLAVSWGGWQWLGWLAAGSGGLVLVGPPNDTRLKCDKGVSTPPLTVSVLNLWL